MTSDPHDPIEDESLERESISRWTPVVGRETHDLLEHLSIPETSKEKMRAESLAIMARCIPPTPTTERETGLVIGYVQSGKTVSFTTVAALAGDNDYQLVIVITGISDPLFHQSKTRLQRDLRLPIRPDRKWQFFENPRPQSTDGQAIADVLAEWSDPSVPPAERQTVLITVMKNHRHLSNLIEVLSRLRLERVPALVIDDEADQAGLNTLVRQGDESTTYQRLVALRACLPHHTYLQYTATPQAPLLINLIDVLSPAFAQVLTPGEDYVGGKDFFLERPELVSAIPDAEIPTRQHHLNEPPQSLLYAMQIFFLGVAAGVILEQSQGNRSMLVHPSQETLRHAQYFDWVRDAKEHWTRTLALPENDPDRHDLLEEFCPAYDDLSSTVKNLPSFDELVSRLRHAIRRTRVEEVNATRGKTPHIDWKAAYPYILVGGQAMDRGFTVEGLTVTYMPRGTGVGNADTIQQRARFFGYKRRYLDYCRVFLENAARDAYRHYVAHEEDIRSQLLDYKDKPLDEWKRIFFLNRRLRPTRNNVLDLDYMRLSIVGDEWSAPRAPHDSPEAVRANREIVAQFLGQLELHEDAGHAKRTVDQRHLVAVGVSLAIVYRELLLTVRVTRPSDSQRHTLLLLQVARYLEQNPDAKCSVYVMGGGRPRERKLTDNDEVENFFQGSNSVGGELTYPGDRQIRAENGLTIQIRRLNLTQDKKIVADDVPSVAVWVPKELSEDWVLQDQGGK